MHEGRERFPLSASVGDRYPASATAVGTALLSELTPEQVAELYWDPREFVGFTERSTTTLAQLQAKLDQTRDHGYALDEGEVHSTVLGLAVLVPGRGSANHHSVSAYPSCIPPDPRKNATPSSKPCAPPHGN